MFDLSTARAYFANMGATEALARSVAETASSVPLGLWTAIVSFFLLSIFLWSLLLGEASRFPSINYKSSEWTYLPAKKRYAASARQLLAQGFRKFTGPFTLVTDLGPLVMLSPDMIDAINHEPALSFEAYNRQELLAGYDTFRTFRPPPGGLFEDVVMKGLTRSLPKFTKPLSDEMSDCLHDSWADADDWHDVNLREDVLAWVSRLSTRIFVGERLCKNKDWLRISVDFTVDCFIGQATCRRVPGPLRWAAVAFLPITRKIRQHYKDGARILAPIIDERHAEIAAAKREGRTPDLPNDAIEWFRSASKGRVYNEVDMQMSLAVAAIHTTSDLLTQAVLNLCAHPHLFEPLRAEAVAVLQKFGWKKVALTELRLLDSFFKETQRIKPIAMVTMNRRATSDVELPNGLKIKRGERTAISSHHMWSTDTHENPENFDAYRFLERRKIPGYENRSLLVSTSQDHTAFSHGKHACPGRFFAANEVKIAMVHLLLKYDIRIESKEQAKWSEYGFRMFTNRQAKISVRRRRQPEIDVDAVPSDL